MSDEEYRDMLDARERAKTVHKILDRPRFEAMIEEKAKEREAIKQLKEKVRKVNGKKKRKGTKARAHVSRRKA